MKTILTLIGAALLGYVVFLISGVGIALIAFSGICILMFVIYSWLCELNDVGRRRHENTMNAFVQVINRINKKDEK